MYYLIQNPSSHSSGTDKVWGTALGILRRRGIPFREFTTGHPGHATELAEEITSGDPEAVVVVVGGDGTIHEVLNGLRNLSTVTFGVIPRGSGNDFARGMNIPVRTEDAVLSIIERNRVVRMDIGCIRTKGGTERFGVSAGIGFDASVCHEALASPIKQKLNGFGAGSLTYSVIAAKQIALYKTCTVSIETDGDRRFTFPDVYFTAVMNQPYEGGGCKMVPGASATDGILDVILVNRIPRAVLVAALPLTRVGGHTKVPGVHFLRCRSLEIRTSGERPIHLDGESGGLGDSLSVSLLPEKLQVIVS